MRFFWLSVGYFVAVMLAWFLAWPTKMPSRDYLARLKMVTNHKIVASDLQRPNGFAEQLGFYIKPTSSVEGKYITPTQGVIPGQSINEKVFSEIPNMTLPEKSVSIAFPSIDPKLVKLLDAGSQVTLFGQDTDTKNLIDVSATVHAILCDPATNSAAVCYPILRLSESQAPVVLKNMGTLKLVAASIPSSQ